MPDKVPTYSRYSVCTYSIFLWLLKLGGSSAARGAQWFWVAEMGFESRRSGFDLGRPGRETFAALHSILPSNGKVIRGASLRHSHYCLTAEKGADVNAQGGEMVTLYRPHPLNATTRLSR